MAIFLRQSHNVKPSRWGSFADVQYAIRVNSEKIYDCNPDDDVLVMPLFWGLPCWDYSGYNNHGTNHGATYKDGSLDFGGNDYVDVDGTSLITSPSAITVSAWARPDSLTVDQRLISRWATQFMLWMDTGGVGDGWAWIVATSAGDVKIGEDNSDASGGKQFIVGTALSAGQAKIYVDGQETDSIALPGNISASAANILVGKFGSAYFGGVIDEVRIAKTDRSADTISLFYDRPWDLYLRIARPIWSIPAVEAIAPTSTIYGSLVGPMGGPI